MSFLITITVGQSSIQFFLNLLRWLFYFTKYVPENLGDVVKDKKARQSTSLRWELYKIF